MGKLCSLSRHTTFLLGGIADLKCKMVKNAGQHLVSLFTRAEKILKFHSSSCKIGGSKPPRAFVKLVEGSVVTKFGTPIFVHLLEILEKNRVKQGQLETVLSRGEFHARCRAATCHVGLAVVPPGTHTGVGPLPPVRGRAS
jgi:hypothetical protein